MSRRSSRAPLAALTLACLAEPLAAATGPALATEADTLEPVVVTATRTARTVDQTLAPVTLITRADIERLQPRTLPELLRGLPGLDFAGNGAFGKNTSFFLRGTDDDQLLVLVDGVRWGSATSGGAALELLPPAQIERIEIVRGPRTSLYGADAAGGVIQIFTRGGAGALSGEPGLQPSAAMSAGRYDTRSARAGFASGNGRTQFGVYASQFETDGYDVQENGVPTGFGSTPVQPDADGYRNSAGSARLAHRFDGGTLLEASVLRSEGETEYDGAPDETEFVQQVISTGLLVPVSDGWDSVLRIGESRDEGDNFTDGTFFSTFDTTQRTASWQNVVALTPAHQLTLGADWRRDEVDSTTAFTRDSRDNWALFVQDEFGAGPHQVIASLRRDDNEAYGVETTGNLAYGYAIGGGANLTASYGTAFVAPTFNDLFFPDVGFFAGNPELEPETLQTAELGLDVLTPAGRLAVQGFRTEIDDLIVFDALLGSVSNLDEAVISGAEASLETVREDWRLFGALTVLDPENRQTGAVLPRRAKQFARVELDRQLGALALGGSWIVQGERYDDVGNTTRLGGYGLVNLRAAYALGRNVSLRATLDNLLDKDYQTIATYRQPGRALLVTLALDTP